MPEPQKNLFENSTNLVLEMEMHKWVGTATGWIKVDRNAFFPHTADAGIAVLPYDAVMVMRVNALGCSWTQMDHSKMAQ